MDKEYLNVVIFRDFKKTMRKLQTRTATIINLGRKQQPF